MRHWHGLVMCDESHGDDDCTEQWGCECSRCKDRQHPMDTMARMRQEEIDRFAQRALKIQAIPVVTRR